MTRGAAAAWLVLLLALLAGCATRAPAPNGEPAPAAAPPLQLQVDAPAPLAALLQQHLDLARLARSPGDDTLDDTELLRLQGAAPAQARALLQTEGYFNATVGVRRDATGPGQPPRVVVSVEPGAQALVGGVSLFTEGDLDRRLAAGDPAARALATELQAAWPLPEGTPFRNADWAAAKATLLTRLRAAGYASAQYSGSAADVDPARARVRLVVVADSGPRYLAGGLQVQGLVHHDEAMVRAQAGFGPGAPLEEALLLDFQERLQKTGLFETVNVGFDPDPAQAGATPVWVRLTELPLQQATLGLGYSDRSGARVQLEHTHRRPFGWPLTAHNTIELGGERQAWEAELSGHPGEGFYRNLLGLQWERQRSSADVVVSQRLRLGRTQDTPRIERLWFVEMERSQQRGSGLRREAQALSLNHHLVLRRLDSVLLPTRGWTLALQAALGRAHDDSGTAGGFVRLWVRATGYWPFAGLPGGPWYGQARLELGQVFKPSGLGLPDSQTFRAGGDDSVRGYAYRSLAPTLGGAIVGGDVLATASAELARPLLAAFPSLWGALFVDAGQAALGWGGLRPDLGLGVGLRWRSPVGPLKLDWAWGEAVNKGRLHLSVGIAF